MRVTHQILRFRYVIAVFVIALSVSMGWHGSSINNWVNYGVSERLDSSQEIVPNIDTSKTQNIPSVFFSGLSQWGLSGMKSDNVLLGVPRMIRSDEWIVQTPFYLAQSEATFPILNTNYGLSGQNMIVAYNAPVKDISIIGKPFNWGFLFLGAEKGLSWYWSFKLVTMLLLAYEFSMILTKRHKLLSVIGSIWITFTPSIQWWFMQHLGDIVYFTLLAIVAIFYYFQSTKLPKKLLFASLLGVSLIGFILVIYPAFQVPFAYVILSAFLTFFFSYLKKGKFRQHDFWIMLGTFMLVLIISGWAITQSWDALQATLHTVYPGQRLSVGGDLHWYRLPEFLISGLLPFIVPPTLNQVELANSVHFLPVIVLGIPFFAKYSSLKRDGFVLFLLVYSLWLLLYTFVPIPTVLSKLTLFSFVTGGRAWQSLSVISVFLSIWFISHLWNNRENSQVRWLILGFVSLFSMLLIAFQNDLLVAYAGRKILLLFSLWFLIILVAAIYQFKRVFLLSLLSLLFLSGVTVNPIVKGLDSIYNKKLSQAIIKVHQDDAEALWLSEGNLYNYPQMFGVKSLNSVRFYPDHTLMSFLDSQGKNEEYWNRYAHMRVRVVDEGLSMTNPAPDILEMSLGIDYLSRLNISYLLSNAATYETYEAFFEPIYGPDKDGNMILKLKKESFVD